MPSIVGVSSSAPSSSSATSFSAARTPGDAAVGGAAGDLLIAVGGHERLGVPSLAGIPDLVVTRAEAGTESAIIVAWKRLVQSDLSQTLSMLTEGGVTRRGSLSYVILRSAGDPTFVHGARAVNGNGDLTAEHPNVTSVGDNAFALSLMVAVSNVVPYARSFSSASPWVEDFESGSSSISSVNAFTYGAHRPVTTGGTSVTGNVVTEATEKFIYWPTSVMVEHVEPEPSGGGSGASSWLQLPSGWSRVELLTRQA